MAGKVAKVAQGGIKAWLLPEINDIKVQLADMRGDVKSLTARVDATNERIDSLRNELKSDISGVSSKVDEMDKRLSSEIREMDKRLTSEIQGVKDSINIIQRVAVLEAKQREFEKKSS